LLTKFQLKALEQAVSIVQRPGQQHQEINQH
jgi:hypothetical protein